MARANNYGKSRKFEVVISPALDEALQKYMTQHKIPTAAQAGRIALANLVGRPELAAGVRRPGRPRKKADPADDEQ